MNPKFLVKGVHCFALLVVFGLWLSVTRVSHAAAIIWNGPTLAFDKFDFVDWTLPQNPDRITESIWLTRANTQGLFNIAAESSYTHLASPSGTEWAFGSTASFSSLAYANWEAWSGNNPPSTIGRDAVLHLIAEDIYIDIKFTSWTASAGGGGFSYIRSTASVPEPSGFLLCGAAACVVLLSRCRRRDGTNEFSTRQA